MVIQKLTTGGVLVVKFVYPKYIVQADLNIKVTISTNGELYIAR